MLNPRKNRFEEMQRERKRSNLLRFFEGLFLGAAVGSIIALLLAPEDGESTRYRISDSASDMYYRGKGMLNKKCCSSPYDEYDYDVDEEVFSDEM